VYIIVVYYVLIRGWDEYKMNTVLI